MVVLVVSAAAVISLSLGKRGAQSPGRSQEKAWIIASPRHPKDNQTGLKDNSRRSHSLAPR